MTGRRNDTLHHPGATSRVLITGAAGGLGTAFAVECAARGWSLFLTDLRAERLDELAGGLRRTYGVSVETCLADLTDPASRAELIAYLTARREKIWALINVAGLDFEGPFMEQSPERIRTILRLNLEGTLGMIQAALPLRDPLRPFHILNVASLAAYAPMPVKATYAASKRFLLDFSLALREELRDLGVTVTALCPAGMPTTPECIRAIDAQGWMGQVTTQNVGAVAAQALDAALRNQAVCIPGWPNQLLTALGRLVPVSLAVSLLGRRWKTAQGKGRAASTAPPFGGEALSAGQSG